MLKSLLETKLGRFTDYEYVRALKLADGHEWQSQDERAEIMCSYIHIFRMHKEKGELDV